MHSLCTCTPYLSPGSFATAHQLLPGKPCLSLPSLTGKSWTRSKGEVKQRFVKKAFLIHNCLINQPLHPLQILSSYFQALSDFMTSDFQKVRFHSWIRGIAGHLAIIAFYSCKVLLVSGSHQDNHHLLCSQLDILTGTSFKKKKKGIQKTICTKRNDFG